MLLNFIQHETITCDNKKPPLFKKDIINLIKKKNILCESNTANENGTGKKEAIKALQKRFISKVVDETVKSRN